MIQREDNIKHQKQQTQEALISAFFVLIFCFKLQLFREFNSIKCNLKRMYYDNISKQRY